MNDFLLSVVVVRGIGPGENKGRAGIDLLTDVPLYPGVNGKKYARQ